MEISKQDNDLGFIAHLLGLLTGFLGPLIIFLVVEENNFPFTKDQAQEALNFQLFILIFIVISTALLFFGIGLVMFLFTLIFDFVFCIIATIASNKGIRYRYPVIIRLINSL